MNFKRYIKESKLTVILVFLMAIAVNAQRIFIYNIGYDTAEYMLAPEWTASVWLSYGRFSLVFMERIVRGMFSSLLLVNLLTAINIGIYTVLFLYFLNMKKETINCLRDCLIALIFLSSPIFLEQYYFTLQVVEVSFAMILFMLALILTQHFLGEKKAWQAILISLLLIFVIGTYQAFANMYIVAVLMMMVREKKDSFPENFRIALPCAILWCVGIVGYVVVKKITTSIYGSVAGSYISGQIGWTAGLGIGLRNVASTCFQVVAGYGHVLNLAFTICGIYVLVKIIREKRLISWNTLVWLFLFISPLLLNIVMGSTIQIRTLMGIPMVVSFVLMEYWNADVIVKIILAGTILSQLVKGQLLLYSDNVRYKEDLALSEKVYEDCGGASSVIVFRGIRSAKENKFSFKGQAMGQSFYEWSGDQTDVDEYQPSNFMTLHGLTFVYPTDEQLEKRSEVTFGGVYPEENYMVEQDGCFYVNLGDK